jgi:heptaprenyl diphosphate synthase
MAFQIIDDVLDYSSSNAVLGKSTANDLKQGIFTLPIIYTIAADKNAFNGLLEKPYFSDQDINSIINIVKSTGSIYECNKLASKYSNKAFNLIRKLPKDDNREMLNSIVKKLLMRKY